MKEKLNITLTEWEKECGAEPAENLWRPVLKVFNDKQYAHKPFSSDGRDNIKCCKLIRNNSIILLVLYHIGAQYPRHAFVCYSGATENPR